MRSSSIPASRPFSFLSFAGVVLLSSVEAVDYREDVRPILNSKCFKCHSGPKAKGSLRMEAEEHFSKRIGGDDPVIIPGDPARSLLSIKAGLPRSDGDAMPPPPARERGAEAMTSGELAIVRQWITEGAKLSSEAPSPTGGETGPTSTPAPAAMKDEVRTWTNTAGAALQASFVSLKGDQVTLRKEDGSEFAYPLANLSAESQALAKQLAGL